MMKNNNGAFSFIERKWNKELHIYIYFFLRIHGASSLVRVLRGGNAALELGNKSNW
jgi:hypothetical protein